LGRYLGEQTDVKVVELEAGTLPRRPDAPQPSLFDSSYSHREEKK